MRSMGARSGQEIEISASMPKAIERLSFGD
jgi:hypothetical protein